MKEYIPIILGFFGSFGKFSEHASFTRAAILGSGSGTGTYNYIDEAALNNYIDEAAANNYISET